MVAIAQFLLLTSIFQIFLLSSNGVIAKNLNLGLGIRLGDIRANAAYHCSPTNVICVCGGDARVVAIRVPQCSDTQLLTAKCKPCKGKNKEDICPKFANCAQCHVEGDVECATCPLRKFGRWCENDCMCQNGADCDRNGKCLCPEGYEGVRCERKKGCAPLPVALAPLQEERQPPDNPVTIIYKCLSNFELRGSTVISCLPSGKWTGSPPQCLRKCPLLSAPANGRIHYSGSELVQGVTAEIQCNENFRLVGEKTLRCVNDGTWSVHLPICQQLAMCPDPGSVPNAVRTALPETPRQIGPFVQDTRLQYSCSESFLQMGSHTLLCLYDGTWSSVPPSCIKVQRIAVDCKTRGKDVMAAVGVKVRIMCPPECANRKSDVWGTSIYRSISAVCPAAVHSGKVTNSGGLVGVVNNGDYVHFAGSRINNIQSESFDDVDKSFRFDKVEPWAQRKGTEGCPKGLDKLNELCVFVPAIRTRQDEANAICNNLGLHLNIPTEGEEQLALATLLSRKGMNEIWTGEAYYESGQVILTTADTNTTVNGTVMEKPEIERCGSAVAVGLSLVKGIRECSQHMNFVCVLSSKSNTLASCVDQGPLDNGKAKPIGKINDVFFVGSSVEYSCDLLHYLKGHSTTLCTVNGTWSQSKPTCERVYTCPEPPVPIGGVVNYRSPLQKTGVQRGAQMRSSVSASRMAGLPVGLSAEVPASLSVSTSTPELQDIPLPPGRHRVGSRAMYDCESRYYQLIGSRTRRCEASEEWSGRPPTCIPVCGRSDSPRSPFIVNGNATDIGQWPWQAGIARWIPDYNRWFLLCGGSLLTEMWVITAAHCVTYAGTTLVIDPDKFNVYLGKYHRMDSKDDDHVQVKKIHEIHVHPDYDPNLFDADIALLHLQSPVQLNSRVQPVCLPTERSSAENLKEGRLGVVTGWGMNENKTYSETLQQAVLPIVSNHDCELGYELSKLPLTVTDNMFCAGFAEGRSDACSGDSGGPMVFTDSSSKERTWALEGIVSWGSPQGCGNPKQYGGFTKVVKFLDWINFFF